MNIPLRLRSMGVTTVKTAGKDTAVVVLIAIAAVLALLLIEWISAGRG